MLIYNILDKDTILERVDAYSIYSFYIDKELEVGKAYSSVLRPKDNLDNIPSFALFFFNDTLFFKDHALGVKGDVFKFVQILYNYTTMLEVFSRINIDFELELEGGIKDMDKSSKKPTLCKAPLVKEKLINILVGSKGKYTGNFIKFFKQYGITSKVLKMYEVTEPSVIQLLYKNRATVIYLKYLTIAYRIGKYYKIYYPKTEHQSKSFITNFPYNYVEGYLQLKYKLDFVIITKALKEVMFFRQHFDWDTVAGKSETTLIPDFIMCRLFKHYKRVFIWLDNDKAGKAAQQKYVDKYSELIPINFTEAKDPTDGYTLTKDKINYLRTLKQYINGS